MAKNVQKALEIKNASISYQEKWIAKYERKYGPIGDAEVLPELKEIARNLESDQQGEIKRQRKDDDMIIAEKPSQPNYRPVPVIQTDYDYYNCEIAFEGKDEFSNKRRIDVQKQILFEHTHAELKPYFKDKIYMTCEGWLSAQPGFKYLTLEFQIASEKARHSFGELQRGAILTLKLIDGTFVNLINTNQDYGAVDVQNKMTYYRGQFVIDKKQEKLLTENELDQIRITWTSGYEDYNIFEMDFFMNQFSCLNSVY